jgi:ligand-binding sensor domain-containing protein
VLAVVVAAAALATAADWLHRVGPAAAAPAPQLDRPLPGTWRTMANGDRINRLARDGSILWAATDGGGLVKWSLADGSYLQFLAPQDGLLSNVISDLELMPDGVIWLATDRALSRWDPLTNHVTNLTPATSPGMPARVVTALEAADDGRLWVGFAQEWDPQLVNDRSRDKHRGAFRPGGLARYDPATNAWDAAFHVDLSAAKNDDFKALPSENIVDLELATDGVLWIAAELFNIYDQSQCEDPKDCPSEDGYWVLAGGGLAAFDGSAWRVFRSTEGSGTCYGNVITDLEPDVDGRMWVATIGKGVLLMEPDIGRRKPGCTSQVGYFKPRSGSTQYSTVGLRGNSVWTVAVDEQGRVWMANGQGYDTGLGIAILTHHDTFDDSSNSSTPWISDDEWQFVDFDGAPGKTDVLVTALDVSQADARYFGTKDMVSGDGAGLRRYEEDGTHWWTMTTAADGLPSNQISYVRNDPTTGELWFALRKRGLARFDGRDWQWWRMFAPGQQVTQVKINNGAGYDRLAVTLPDQAAFDAAFPTDPRYARVGVDPTLYRVRSYRAERNGNGPFLEITPELYQEAKAGTPVYSVYRGPASDTATQIAFDAGGQVWAGGRQSVWTTGPTFGSDCPTFPYCWLDGGLGMWNGTGWSVFDLQNAADLNAKCSGVPSQSISAVEVDPAGRIWVGSGDGKSDGNGVGIYDPSTNLWTNACIGNIGSGQSFGGNGVADLDMDPTNGHVWVAHHSAATWVSSPFGGREERRVLGGGVSLWDGSKWRAWTKQGGANLKAYGNYGEMTTVLVDRDRNRIWAGGWDSVGDPHWLKGNGVNAVLNWCTLEGCSDNGWQNKEWADDGQVAAMALDQDGALWVGTNRQGAGLIPPEAGIKLYDGQEWRTFTPENSGLVSHEITALDPDGDQMWIGTLKSGVSLYYAVPPPTPTPLPSNTPRPTRSPTPTRPRPTATSEESTPTAEGPTPGGATATAGPAGACGPSRWCTLYIPSARQTAACRRCPTTSPMPTPLRATPTSPPPSSTPTVAPSDTPAPTATADSPSATPEEETATEPPPASATPTPRPTVTLPGPTATRTATSSPTTPAIRTWSLFDPGGTLLPRIDYYGVFGFDQDSVWILGENGKLLYWDGQQMNSQELAASATLRRGLALSKTQAYLVGDNGQFFETRSGGAPGTWRRVNTGSYTDDWAALGLIRGAEGLRGWVLGGSQGTRLYFDGSSWAPSSPADRNTGIAYADVAMLSPVSAVALQNGNSGSRMYFWNGTSWAPGPVTGPLFDLHVRSVGQGVAVGPRGTVWRLGADGSWALMSSRPSTGGQDLYATHMVSDDLVWVGGGRTGLHVWNGSDWASQTVAAQTRTIRSMWISPDGQEGWAVGDDGLVLRYR